jgi:hypothetical protein
MHRIFDVLLPVALFGSFGTTLYFFTKVLTDYVLKKKMIEKGYVTEETQSVFKEYKATNKYSALKWGLIIFSAGIALIIIDATGVDAESTLPYGIFAVCLSIGFMVYYYMVKKETR